MQTCLGSKAPSLMSDKIIHDRCSAQALEARAAEAPLKLSIHSTESNAVLPSFATIEPARNHSMLDRCQRIPCQHCACITSIDAILPPQNDS